MTDSVFRKARGVSSRVVDGRAVIVVMSREALHSLNASGTFLWNAIGDGQTRDALRDALVERYGLDVQSADQDIARFLDQLTGLGALEVGHG